MAKRVLPFTDSNEAPKAPRTIATDAEGNDNSWMSSHDEFTDSDFYALGLDPPPLAKIRKSSFISLEEKQMAALQHASDLKEAQKDFQSNLQDITYYETVLQGAKMKKERLARLMFEKDFLVENFRKDHVHSCKCEVCLMFNQ